MPNRFFFQFHSLRKNEVIKGLISDTFQCKKMCTFVLMGHP